MSKKTERERTIATLSREGVPYKTIVRLLRYGAALHRLAEASCNGDWPADNGERKVKACTRCEGMWVPSVLKKGGLCPDCRTEDLIIKTCDQAGLVAEINGDPRGAILLVKPILWASNVRGHYVA